VGLAIGVSVLHLVPLPAGLRGVLAPGPAAARGDLDRLGLAAGWAPVSVDVGETVVEALLWAGAAALLACVGSRDGPPTGARLAVGLLLAVHVVASLDEWAGTDVFPLTRVEDPWGVGQDVVRRGVVSGWLVNRNHWAALGVLLWPVAAAWALRARAPSSRAVGVATALVVAASVVSTKSRAGLGVLALQGVVVALVAGRAARGRARVAVWAVVGLAVVLGAVAAPAYLERFLHDDVVGRVDLYAATLEMAADSPVVGWGMGTFRAAFPAYQPDSLLYSYRHAHNDLLELLAAAGVVGLAIAAALAAHAASAWRKSPAPASSKIFWAVSVAGAAAMAMAEFPLQIPAVRYAWLGLLFAGPPAPRV
jgi:hypothetical protein